MNWNTWIKGLGVALAGAATVSAANVVTNRLQNGPNASAITGQSIGLSAAAGALTAFFGYLIQSPLPATSKATADPAPVK